MSESEFADLIMEAFDEAEMDEVAQVHSFGEAGLLTSNDGVVVRLGDGSEFQLTIVRSR